MRSMQRKAAEPSCIRVPPETGRATSGRCSAVARSTARVIRSAVATPIDPPRKPNSDATRATSRPASSPTPVTTASSTPVRSRARVSEAR